MITVPICPHCDGPEPAEPCHHCGRSTIPEIPPYDASEHDASEPDTAAEYNDGPGEP
jgi:hypothetical protein